MLLTLLTVIQFAVAQPPTCATAEHEPSESPNKNDKEFGKFEARTLDIKLDNQPLTVKYRKYPGSSNQTVIYLCGGPAQCNFRPRHIPPKFNVITYDPIGIGVNYSSSMSPEMKSIESQAKVVQAIAQNLKLTNYVIMGHSFGSTAGTAAAALISASKMPQPKAVILSGANRACATSREYHVRVGS